MLGPIYLNTVQQKVVKFSKDWPLCVFNNTVPKIVIIITSNAENIELRNAQREAFPSDFLWREFQALRYFLIAQKEDFFVMEKVIKENDIILGDFNESYKHLTWKHLMGLSFVVNWCSNQR